MIPSVPHWSFRPAQLSLTATDVHVWRADLCEPGARASSLLQLLAPDERDRAGRFHFQKDRDHFIIARGTLRTILGLYLQAKPQELRFVYSAYGKPALAPDNEAARLRFNVTHSHELALYAVTLGRELGIDVEHLREDMACHEIAERFFSRGEVQALSALPASQRTLGFFNCWTRKEAYIKARGQGLSLPLDNFDVSLAPGEPAALLRTRDDEQEALRWSLRDLNPGSGYAAALAVEGHDWNLDCWHWG
jgi:4'-phosphopantetheinyl transferase